MHSSPTQSLETADIKSAAPVRPVQVDGARKPVAFRGGGFAPKPIWYVAPLVFLALLTVWELGSRYGLISSLVLPAPTEVFSALRNLVESGMLYKHLSASLTRLLIGFTCGTILGTIVGVLTGLYSLPRAAFRPRSSRFRRSPSCRSSSSGSASARAPRSPRSCSARSSRW